MSVAVITGAGGLIGSEAASYFGEIGLDIVGIDNDMRAQFFGEEASTRCNAERLQRQLGRRYRHAGIDIRRDEAVDTLFTKYAQEIDLIVHTAAQPSHDWAAREPRADFTVNANGTLSLLEAARKHAPDAVFIFTSTNKVYGDRPNRLPLVELNTRYEIDQHHAYAGGIPDYPWWRPEYDIPEILREIYEANIERLTEFVPT